MKNTVCKPTRNFFERMMAQEGVFFSIETVGGKLSKIDRIKRLIPDFQNGRWIMPETLIYTDVEGNAGSDVRICVR